MNTFNLAQQLSDEQLVQLLSLFTANSDVIKYDRKIAHQLNSQDIYLSHSIVKHTDTDGNIFYDVYAKDNEIDGETRRKEAANVVESLKNNILGTGTYSKVKPIIARFYEKDGKLVQVLDPGLVVKIFNKEMYRTIDELVKTVAAEADELQENYVSIAISATRPAKKNANKQKASSIQSTADIVMPKLPLDLKKAWHKEYTGDPSFSIMLDRLNLVIALCEAVNDYHVSHNAIIGDFKLENSCYDAQTKAAFLIDFQQTKLIIGSELMWFPHSPDCAAPEVLHAHESKQFVGQFNTQIDVYSLGVNIARALGMFNYIGRIVVPKLPCTGERDKFKASIIAFIQRLTHDNPNKRPDIKEAITFFNSVRDYYIAEKSLDEAVKEEYDIEYRDAKRNKRVLPDEVSRKQELTAEITPKYKSFEPEVIENQKAHFANPEIYFKKLDFLTLNIEEVMRDIQQQQIRLIHKTEKSYTCDFAEGEVLPEDPISIIPAINMEDRKKYLILGSMLNDLEITKTDIKTKVNELRVEIAKPENQASLAQANPWRVKARLFFKDYVQHTMNIISLDKDNHYILERQTRFAWIRKILRGIASIFSETKGLPASAQALIAAGHKLDTVMHASTATIEAAVNNQALSAKTSRRNSMSSEESEESAPTRRHFSIQYGTQ